MPSLPAMVYLEKEIQQMNGEIDEFDFSSEFIDSVFDKSNDGQVTEQPSDEEILNLDCLLGQ